MMAEMWIMKAWPIRCQRIVGLSGISTRDIHVAFDQESNFVLPIYPKNFRAVKFLNNKLICLVGEILRQKSN